MMHVHYVYVSQCHWTAYLNLVDNLEIFMHEECEWNEGNIASNLEHIVYFMTRSLAQIRDAQFSANPRIHLKNSRR